MRLFDKLLSLVKSGIEWSVGSVNMPGRGPDRTQGSVRKEADVMAGSPLIVTFCSRDYIPVLANFVAALRKRKQRPLRIYCLDAETYEFCLSADVQARMLTWDGSLESLWTKRVAVFCELIADGHDFIHSDVDAVWFRDPVDLWTSDDVDMVFSQGTIHPPDAHQALGFVLCCGFFRMNATGGVERFLDRLAGHVARTGDDQESVNRVLIEAGTQWQNIETPDYRLRVRGQSFNCWKEPVQGYCQELDLTISLIPHSVVQRTEDPSDTMDRVCVKHPLAAKDPRDKLEELGRQGLLAVRQDWYDLPSSAVFADYFS